MLSLLMTTEYAPAEDRYELQRLLLRVAGGEREALAELYQRTRSAVYGLALSYLKNAHDAQDLTQDVYVQVWDCAEQYRPTGSPMGWLLAVCRNLCLMRLRREERHAALSEEEWDAIPAQECGLDADERTLFVCSHFSHNGFNVNGHAMTFSELSVEARKRGLSVAYDGMMLDI